jgi:hypothetical protein
MALIVASQQQADRLRADTGTNTTSLPDASVDAIWTEAGETYTDASSLSAYARIIVFRRMLAGVIPINDYRQNESEEKAGAMFAKVKETLALWLDELAAAVADSAGSRARFGKTQYKPLRIKEYPRL